MLARDTLKLTLVCLNAARYVAVNRLLSEVADSLRNCGGTAQKLNDLLCVHGSEVHF